jgi:hypothetical protein
MNPTKMGGDVEEEEEEEEGLGEAVDADASAEPVEEGDVEDMVRVGLVSVMPDYTIAGNQIQISVCVKGYAQSPASLHG